MVDILLNSGYSLEEIDFYLENSTHQMGDYLGELIKDNDKGWE